MTRHSSTMVLSRAATFIALLVFLIDSALCQSSSNDTLEITTTRPSSSLELETTISPIEDRIIEITTLEPSSTLERETTVSPVEDRINSTSEAAAILSCGSDTSNNNGTVKSKRETYEANFSLKAIQRALEDAFPGNDEKQLESMSRCIYNATVEVEKFLSDLLASVKGDNSSSNNNKSDTSEDDKKPAVNQQLDAIQKASLSIQSVFSSPDIQKELTGLLKSLVNIEKFNKDVSDIIDKLKDILDDVSKKLRENSSGSPNTSKVEEPVDEAEARPIDSDDDDDGEPIVEDEDVLEPAKVSRDAPKFNCSSPLQYAIKVLSMDQDTDECGAKSADPAQRCPCVTLLVEPSGSSSQAQSKC